MLKYLKYFIPALTGLLTIYFFLQGENYPTVFLICFSSFLIIGDLVFPRDKVKQKFTYPDILNLSIYINLPILLVLIILVVSIFSNNLSQLYIELINSIYNIDFFQIKSSYTLIDKISIIVQTVLLIGDKV